MAAPTAGLQAAGGPGPAQFCPAPVAAQNGPSQAATVAGTAYREFDLTAYCTSNPAVAQRHRKTIRLADGKLVKAKPELNLGGDAKWLRWRCTLPGLADKLRHDGDRLVALSAGLAPAEDGESGELGYADEDRRGKDRFTHRAGAALLVIDVDGDHVPAAWGREGLTPGGLVQHIRTVLPALDADCVFTSSASSYLEWEGGGAVGLHGAHLLFVLENGLDIPVVLAALHRQACLAGAGHVVVSGAAVPLVRSVVDMAFKTSNQLCYEGPANCLEGVRQQRRVEFFAGARRIVDGTEVLVQAPASTEFEEWERREKDSPAVKEEVARVMIRRDAEELEKCRAEGLSEEVSAARRAALARLLGQEREYVDLPAEFALRTVRGGRSLLVSEVMENPEAYHNWRVCDPLEPDYRGGFATIKTRGQTDGQPKVLSRAHGVDTTYFLKGLKAGSAASKTAEGTSGRSGREASEKDAVKWLNDQFVYFHKLGVVFRRTNTKDVWTKELFTLTPWGKRPVIVGKRELKAARVWMESDNQAVAESMDWLPERELGAIRGTVLNTWPGLAVTRWLADGVVGDPARWVLFKAHVLVLCEGRAELRDIALAWIAQALRHPTKKPKWEWVIYDAMEGIGKSGLAEIMGQMVGGGLYHAFKDKEVSGDFVGKEAEGVLFGAFGDITANHGNRRDTTKFYHEHATASEITVHDKGISRYTVRNYMRCLISFNKPEIITSEGNRRLFVTGAALPADYDTAEKYGAWFRANLLGCVTGTDRTGIVGIYQGLMAEYGAVADLMDLGAEPPKTETFHILCEDSQPHNQQQAVSMLTALLEELEAGRVVAFTSKMLESALALEGVQPREMRSASQVVLNGLRAWWHKNSSRGKTLPCKVGRVDGVLLRITVVGTGIETNMKEEKDRTRCECVAEVTDVKIWLKSTQDVLLKNPF